MSHRTSSASPRPTPAVPSIPLVLSILLLGLLHAPAAFGASAGFTGTLSVVSGGGMNGYPISSTVAGSGTAT